MQINSQFLVIYFYKTKCVFNFKYPAFFVFKKVITH